MQGAETPATADHVTDQAIDAARILDLVFDAAGHRDLGAGHVGRDGTAIGKYFIARKQVELVPYRFQRLHLVRQRVGRARIFRHPGALAKTEPPEPARETHRYRSPGRGKSLTVTIQHAIQDRQADGYRPARQQPLQHPPATDQIKDLAHAKSPWSFTLRRLDRCMPIRIAICAPTRRRVFRAQRREDR